VHPGTRNISLSVYPIADPVAQIGRLDEALRVAAEIKDPNHAIDALNRIKAKCAGDPKLLQAVNEMIDKVEAEVMLSS